MFDPDLWKRTKVGAIALLVLGAVLLLPTGYVFYLAAIVLGAGGPGFIRPGDEAFLFWSALIGSSSGVLAWIALWLLLFQPRNIRIHLLVWHVVRGAGAVIIPCLGIWIWLVADNSKFHFPQPDAFIFLVVLLTILAAALLLVWTGQRNLGFTRAAGKRVSGKSSLW